MLAFMTELCDEASLLLLAPAVLPPVCCEVATPHLLKTRFLDWGPSEPLFLPLPDSRFVLEQHFLHFPSALRPLPTFLSHRAWNAPCCFHIGIPHSELSVQMLPPPSGRGPITSCGSCLLGSARLTTLDHYVLICLPPTFQPKKTGSERAP